ncbi:substrate-binding domain-containing protein [Prochlorothrix hollandica]|uniref:substrate-binding domain-containing protein n=1 Tax=Prochlorothrix hollandica TaxID=1223 RepID=UPI003341F959
MKLNRRSFLVGSTALSLTTALSACGSPPPGLDIRILQGSLPPQLVGAFHKTHPTAGPLRLTPADQPAQLFRLLQRWHSGQDGTPPQGLGQLWPFHRPDTGADLLSLGDAWLAAAIAQNLIQPFPDPQQWDQWSQMPEPWRSLVQRDDRGFPIANDPSGAQGQIWAAPYRWGSTLIAYRQDQCQGWGWEPQDWIDLWREEVQGSLALPDNPREVVGLALKSLGYSYNEPNPAAIPDLPQTLARLQRQVKLYSSDHYLQPLLLGDVAVAVGWSTDLLPLLVYDRNIRLVVPPSGTALWADLWVRPRGAAGDLGAVNHWINFCWDQSIAPKFAQLGQGTSPLALMQVAGDRPPRSPVLLPDPGVIDRSEFINPLPAAALAHYQTLWDTMRRSR